MNELLASLTARRRSGVIAFVSLALLAALTGCTATGSGGSPADGPGDGPDPGAAPADGGTASGHSDTACVSGSTWSLDVDEAARQLLAMLQESGSPAVSATGTGSQEIFFEESGAMGSTTDVTFVVVIPVESGITMTMTQHQFGPANGDWAWIDDTNEIGFSDWISGYSVETTIDINGSTSTSESPLPADGAAGTDMTVLCSGSTMTTSSEGSPFTMHWTRGD